LTFAVKSLNCKGAARQTDNSPLLCVEKAAEPVDGRQTLLAGPGAVGKDELSLVVYLIKFE